jgi:hypothetical protein
VHVHLTAADASALAAVLQEAARDFGWIGSAEAARIAGVKPGTLRSYVFMKGPRRHPFPPPWQASHNNLWRRAAVEQWKKEHDALAARGQDHGASD